MSPPSAASSVAPLVGALVGALVVPPAPEVLTLIRLLALLPVVVPSRPAALSLQQ